MKRLILLSLCFAGAAAAALAASDIRAQYRIVMKDGRVLLSRDLPKEERSVTRFHADGSGALTEVPSGQIARIETSVTPQRFVPTTAQGAALSGGGETGLRPMQPGEVVVLGPIGEGGGGSIANQAAAAGALNGAAGAGGTGVGAYGGGNYVNGNGRFSNGASNGTLGFDPRMLGGGAPSTGLLPNGQPSTQPVAGDVLRAQSGEVPTMSIDTQTQTSPNGFPPNASSQTTTLNPSGQPNTAVTGPVAGSTQPIGPNGFPGTPQNVTGPNGFPVTGGAATSSQNVTGPNGFTGPTQSTPQNVTNPNGFPAAGAPGTGATATGAGQVIVLPNGTITNVQGANRGTSGTNGTSAIPQQRGTQQRPGAARAPGQGAAAPSGGGAAPSGSSGPGH